MTYTQSTSIEFGAVHELDKKSANKVALGALVGSVLEYYDFFLFSAAAALVFNVQYFTSGNATLAALASFATFGVGVAARPIGGIVFGAMGDRIGRRKTLMITIVGIGIITALIGILPTYAAIGIAAPVLLVLLRIVQGLFVGGEWSGALTLVVENAPLHMRARYAVIPLIGSPIGTILSSGGFFWSPLQFRSRTSNPGVGAFPSSSRYRYFLSRFIFGANSKNPLSSVSSRKLGSWRPIP